MGGAGAWHIGAHYADRWDVVHAGAGFAETARYNRLTPDKYPVWYEQKLWGLYDVPGYARNLLNVPVIAYSGEIDKQKQAADLMQAELKTHGLELTHIIGPNMPHKYDPGSRDKVLALIKEALAKRKPPREIHFQTRTLRYPSMHWFKATGLEEHWAEARADGSYTFEGGALKITLATENITALEIDPAAMGLVRPESRKSIRPASIAVSLDGQELAAKPGEPIAFHKTEGGWKAGAPAGARRKKPGLQGPIDDAFMAPFLCVEPTGEALNPAVGRWVEFELAHFKDRWRALFRGDAPSKKADAVTKTDLQDHNLILWGDPRSNPAIAKILPDLPIEWGSEIKAAGKSYAAAHHVPILIFPNPLNPERYIVINSGPTFREGHDGTNSQQNPKLPDWAIIDLTEPPSATAPGKIVAADFFGETWDWKTPPNE
ncbi:MAG: hypothetical protein R3F11_05190 [Verrucomicrobiales bacterium]